MFENVKVGSTVLLQMEGSTEGLAMRAVYDGETGGSHLLRGTGVMADVAFSAACGADGWRLANGRRLLAVEAV